jgi:phage tail sheath protein FI
MPEYLSPGVYIEEVDAGPKPIEGVSTSTTGAVGVTERGPTDGKPELVTSFADFTRIFGGFLPEPDQNIVNKWALDAEEGGRWWYFPLAVKGFFDNGGQRLYVKRVFSSAATPASDELGRGLVSEIIEDAPASATVIRVRHLLGVRLNPNVQIHAAGQPLAANPFVVNAYDAT